MYFQRRFCPINDFISTGKFMRDYWGFIQEWFAPDGDLDKWWSDFHAAANKFSEDYAGCKFAQEHILCFCLYQEKKYRL